MQYEELTEEQKALLKKFVTNTEAPIFALQNLPEVIKGALFSRYSRSTLSLRELLIKDFIINEEAAFSALVGQEKKVEEQVIAIQKAQNFYDRILDGYGDDSIGELGGAHLACEQITLLAAKILEDCRIGGSPLEKSTRYVYFDQKINGKYAYYRDPRIMSSSYAKEYETICDHLFDTYSELSKELTPIMEKTFPRTEDISKGAYNAALRAKVLDCLRGLLPASTLTNMGVFGNGRFFEMLIQKIQAHPLHELRVIGEQSFTELNKVIPSFVRRSEKEHRHNQSYATFTHALQERLQALSHQHSLTPVRTDKATVQLVDYDKESPHKVAAALLFEHTDASLQSLLEHCRNLNPTERNKILHAAAQERKNRRHKSPRALENAFFTFEITADFGTYRDLQRHRMLSQNRQLLTCHEGYTVPPEIQNTPLEERYISAMEKAKTGYVAIAQEMAEEAQYIVPMGYRIRWYKHVNLRALQWLCELRSTPQGHADYRFVAQAMADQVIRVLPEYAPFLSFVDFEGYTLGRLQQEIRIDAKRKTTSSI